MRKVCYKKGVVVEMKHKKGFFCVFFCFFFSFLFFSFKSPTGTGQSFFCSWVVPTQGGRTVPKMFTAAPWVVDVVWWAELGAT